MNISPLSIVHFIDLVWTGVQTWLVPRFQTSKIPATPSVYKKRKTKRLVWPILNLSNWVFAINIMSLFNYGGSIVSESFETFLCLSSICYLDIFWRLKIKGTKFMKEQIFIRTLKYLFYCIIMVYICVVCVCKCGHVCIMIWSLCWIVLCQLAISYNHLKEGNLSRENNFIIFCCRQVRYAFS